MDKMIEPSGSTYATVAHAISYLQAHAGRQPSLSELARAVGRNEFQLQRAFSGFAGVSPKRFLQYLTKEHAKRLLAESSDVLDAAYQSGMSGPGRLHDLMVTCEALTPGEIRRRGAGVKLRCGFGETPLGRALAAFTSRGLAYFGFVDAESGGDGAALDDLRQRWPSAALAADRAVGSKVAGMFGRWREGGPLHLVLLGTNLQLKVWEALLAIPEGRVTTYSRLAQAVERPDAVRAVASAVARNPVSVLIPCHRVIRGSGDLGGYHWGLPRKAALIALESAHVCAAAGDSNLDVAA